MAKSSLDKAVDKAIKEIKKRIGSVVDDIGYDIAEQIQIKWDNCVDAFYNDWNPIYYDRTYSTYMASDGEDGVSNNYSVKETDSGFEITAGINIDSSRLGTPYKDPTDYVFQRTWEEGIHGTQFHSIKVKPKELMDKWFEEYKKTGHRLTVSKHLRRVGFNVGSRRR